MSQLLERPRPRTRFVQRDILSLMGDETKVVFSFRESTVNFRANGKAWARDAEMVEELIQARRPQSDILFHRRPGKKSGYPQWATIVQVS